MGNASRKLGDAPHERTGLSPREVKLVQDSWHAFCRDNREYGVVLFLSMFVKHPEYLRLFPNYRGKPMGTLKDDPVFRAHGCAIGFHLTSMVDSLNDPDIFEVLARKNGARHLKFKSVTPAHFEGMGACLLGALRAKKELMTPDAVEAWGKFLTAFVAIVKNVYDEAAAQCLETGGTMASSHVAQDEASVGAASGNASTAMATTASTTPKKKRGNRKPSARRIVGSPTRRPEDETKATSPKEDGKHKDTLPQGKKEMSRA